MGAPAVAPEGWRGRAAARCWRRPRWCPAARRSRWRTSRGRHGGSAPPAGGAGGAGWRRGRRARSSPSRFVPERVEADVRRDAIQPGAEPRTALEAFAPAPGSQEGLLHEVLGLLERTDHPVAVHVQLPAVTLDERGERGLVASSGGGDDAVPFTGGGRRPSSLEVGHEAALRSVACWRINSRARTRRSRQGRRKESAARHRGEACRGYPGTRPQVTLVIVPVIPAARSEARNASTAASAGPVLPIIGALPLADPLVSERMTPDPCVIIWRAAARAVRNCDVSPVVTALVKSAPGMSISGTPWMSPRVIRLKETSMLPAWEATALACSSTARSSSASTSATSAAPPAAAMSAATVSSGCRVRPARKTLAPSRANVRATPPPIPPPAP